MKLLGPQTLFLGLLLALSCPAAGQNKVLSNNQTASDARIIAREASPTISISAGVVDIKAGSGTIAINASSSPSLEVIATSSVPVIATGAEIPVTEPVATTTAVQTSEVTTTEVTMTQAPQTAAEIIAEANALAARYSVSASTTEELVPENVIEESPVASAPIESTDPDLESVVGDVESENVEQTPDVASETKTVEESEPEVLYEKADALQPVLMVKGAPIDEVSDVDSIAKISGKIVPEKKPLGGRRNVYRWVLKTADRQRIPLKSNLKLLQEVKREKLLDGFVTLTGKFVQSGFSKELRYFVVESAVMIDELPQEKKALPEDDAKQPADNSTEKSSEKPAGDSRENSSENPTENSTDKSAGKPLDNSADEPALSHNSANSAGIKEVPGETPLIQPEEKAALSAAGK